MMTKPDYSTYTFSQLLKARYWKDTQGGSLEEEIQNRCTTIRARTNGTPSDAAGSSRRFRPYGLIFSVAFFLMSVGPFGTVKFLDAIDLIKDVNGDTESLAGLWALLMLPLMLSVFMLGSIKDAERVVKWFNLDGRQNS